MLNNDNDQADEYFRARRFYFASPDENSDNFKPGDEDVWDSFYFFSGTDRLETEYKLGWRLYLNVAPDQVVRVSDYLRDRKWFHEYLYGDSVVPAGELIRDGRIFTVYTGSYSSTQKIANEISEHLGISLSKPKAPHAIEFARGVVGSFYGWGQPQGPFLSYGENGISYLKQLPQNEAPWEASFVALSKMYGSYFIDNSGDKASISSLNPEGGIDLTSDKALTVHNNGQKIKFHLDPAQMVEWQHAPGITFDIVNMHPMINVRAWLEDEVN